MCSLYDRGEDLQAEVETVLTGAGANLAERGEKRIVLATDRKRLDSSGVEK